MEGEIHVTNLREALASHDVIGQAIGILMEREKCTKDEALALLRRASQGLNIKVRQLAEELVDGLNSGNDDNSPDSRGTSRA